VNVAVTGAYSYSGKYIARRLLARGDKVRCLTGHAERPDPFGGRVPAFPLEFSKKDGLRNALRGVQVLVNTYWIRFDRGSNTQARAIRNTAALIEAAREAGVRRVVHISITNPSPDSQLPYYSGKAENEATVERSGLAYSILGPTVLFGLEDILIDNIAYLMHRFPVFMIPGDGGYRLQPVYVDDLAELAENAVHEGATETVDAVGPEVFTFRELVLTIGQAIGRRPKLIRVAPDVAVSAARLVGFFLGDVLLTSHEVEGLMANLLVSGQPPRCRTRLTTWLHEHGETLGRVYASEIGRHYQRDSQDTAEARWGAVTRFTTRFMQEAPTIQTLR
jgi:uncharacterized protein YbjT (DUF2867 family)